MKTTTYICDNCGKDITTTDAKPRYRIVVYSESMPHNTNRVAMILVHPPFTGEKVLCDLQCLKEWAAKL